MATRNPIDVPRRVDHPVRPTRTANYHYAAMRRYEDAARSISVQLSVRGFLARFADESLTDEIAEMRATQTSYYLHAAAHRNAAHRLERGERIRIRLERALRPVTRIVRSVRRAVTA